MFDFNWPELLIIATVALIVIGPEDLPNMFRQLGRFTTKLRQMSREFSRAMEQAAKDTGVKDVVKDLKSATSSKALGLDAVRDAADRFEKWDPMKSAPTLPSAAPARTLVPPPMPATPVAAIQTDDYAEAEDDIAAHGDILPPAHGASTQALYDKQALRSQVLQEQTEKLKAIEQGTYRPATPPIAPPVTKPQSAPKADVVPKADLVLKADMVLKADVAPEPKKRAAKVAGVEMPADVTPTDPKPRKTTRKPSGKETA